MHARIEPDALLTDEQARVVRAALALAGIDQQRFARAKSISYFRLNRVINQREIPGDLAPQLRRLAADLRRHATAA